MLAQKLLRIFCAPSVGLLRLYQVHQMSTPPPPPPPLSRARNCRGGRVISQESDPLGGCFFSELPAGAG